MLMPGVNEAYEWLFRKWKERIIKLWKAKSYFLSLASKCGTASVHLSTALGDARVTKATDSPAPPACCAATWEYHNGSAFRLQVGGSENSQIVKMPICHVPTFIC